jgi:hypothetical protein
MFMKDLSTSTRLNSLYHWILMPDTAQYQE